MSKLGAYLFLLAAAGVVGACAGNQTSQTNEPAASQAQPQQGPADTLGSACDKGDGASCVKLAIMFKDGAGVAKDPERSAALFSRACDAAVAEGCFYAGAQNLMGQGVAKDPARGVLQLTVGCKGGNADACFLMATIAEGLIQVTDASGSPLVPKSQAKTFFKLACDAGNTEACNRLKD